MSISYSYADDILIFSSTSSSSLQSIMGVLRRYESVSDQKVNASKSRYLVHSNMSSSRRVLIERIKGFSFKDFPVRYLGCPLFVGQRKKIFLEG